MKRFLILFLIFLSISANASYSLHMPRIAPEKLRQMQEYNYQINDIAKVRESIVATLQDSDFIIQSIDSDLGFIHAQKIFKAPYVNKKRVAGWSAVFALATAYTVFSYGSTAASMYSPSRRVATEMKDKTVVVDINVFIEQTGREQIRVKFLPIAKVLQNADGFAFYNNAPIRVLRIYKPQIYNEFFTQVKNYIY